MTRLVFLGTPEAAVPSLNALAEAGHEVALVVTREDKRRGRGNSPSPTPVKIAALELGIPISHSLSDVMKAKADLAVVVAYGRIIPVKLLNEIPFLNVHFSLLPRWRGAAPVERAILAGDRVSGVCIMKLDEGLDTGPVYSCKEISLDDIITRSELTDRLAQIGAQLLVDLLSGGIEGLPEPVEQIGDPVYAAKIEPDDLRIDWRCSVDEISRKVRLERAWTMFRGKRIIIGEVVGMVGKDVSSTLASRDDAVSYEGMYSNTLQDTLAVSDTGRIFMLGSSPVVRCGDGAIVIRTVQPEGHTKMAAEAWARGARIGDGDRFD